MLLALVDPKLRVVLRQDTWKNTQTLVQSITGTRNKIKRQDSAHDDCEASVTSMKLPYCSYYPGMHVWISPIVLQWSPTTLGFTITNDTPFVSDQYPWVWLSTYAARFGSGWMVGPKEKKLCASGPHLYLAEVRQRKVAEWARISIGLSAGESQMDVKVESQQH